MELLRDSSPDDPARDMSLTRVIVHEASAGPRPVTVRVFQPGPTVAFGRRDKFNAGFEMAARAARSCGFLPVLRHAGGHAVAYDQNSVSVEWIRPEMHLMCGIEARFERLSGLIRDALCQLGVAVELGALPDEYCSGSFSLHLPQGPKVVGVAQHVIKGASLTTAVIAVAAGDRLRAVTGQVYRHLGLSLDISTVGAVADCFPDTNAASVAEALAAG